MFRCAEGIYNRARIPPMRIPVGTFVGSYEVLAQIGAGGMGEVYRARDTELRRDVALKVLPAAFAADSERMARFQREAETLAALNHPNIAAIYGITRTSDGIALVMEYVDGEPPRGPMPLDQAWAVAAQIAAALEYAHERGVVHRDLKPANVKVTPDGVVKLLDFGIAKALQDPATGAAADQDHSPTVTFGATVAGTILGTAAYMAPEQARGRRVDQRVDIWAWGVVFAELLTGKRLFAGADVQETLAFVLTREPDLSSVPARARRLISKCLEKDPRVRLRHIGDAASLLDDGAPSETVRRTARWLWPAVAAASLLAAAAIGAVHYREAPPRRAQPARFQFTTPRLPNGVSFYLTVSPDGRQVAFTADRNGRIVIWVRSLETLESRALPGTEDAASLFWSPDSKMIGFASGRQLKKIDASGASPAVTLCEVTDGAVGLGTWGTDGTILFGARGSGGIKRVADSGGTPTDVTKPNPPESHTYPVFLPDGRHFLYFHNTPNPEARAIGVGSLDVRPEEQTSERLLTNRFGGRYVPPPDHRSGVGRILYSTGINVMAQPFDVSALKLVGDPVLVASGVGAAGVVGFFGVSADTLAYRAGGGAGAQPMQWLDRDGGEPRPAGDAAAWDQIRISPDGRRIAGSRSDAAGDIWIVDLERGSSSRFTSAVGLENTPIWSPDGSQIAYSAQTGPQGSVGPFIMRQAADAGSEPEVLLRSQREAVAPQDWSPDGRYLLFARLAQSNVDLFALPLDGDRTPVPVVATAFIEAQGQFSPDGQWVTYMSTESGSLEVYVRPFLPPGSNQPRANGRWMISKNGGSQPRWRRDGREIVYLGRDGRLMGVDIAVEAGRIRAGVPRALRESRIVGGFDSTVAGPRWDMTADGKRFLVVTPGSQPDADTLTVVLDWQSALP